MSTHLTLDKLELPNFAIAVTGSDGKILEASENWKNFGFQGLNPGSQIEEVIESLFGIFPLSERFFHLPYIASPNGMFLDLDLRLESGFVTVVGYDVSEKASYVQRYQQVCNELEIMKRESGLYDPSTTRDQV